MEHVVETAAEMDIAKSVRTWIVSVEVNRLFLFYSVTAFYHKKKTAGIILYYTFILYSLRVCVKNKVRARRLISYRIKMITTGQRGLKR